MHPAAVNLAALSSSRLPDGKAENIEMLLIPPSFQQAEDTRVRRLLSGPATHHAHFCDAVLIHPPSTTTGICTFRAHTRCWEGYSSVVVQPYRNGWVNDVY